jgi:hypothetical protein
MKKTAMQILKAIVIEIKSKGHEIDINGLEDWIDSVGEPMEKEQIEKAFNVGYSNGYSNGIMYDQDEDFYQSKNSESKQYYNETFKSE